MPRVRSTGFAICPNDLLDQISSTGGKQRVCVYLMLHRYGNGSRDGCYASVSTLSNQLGMSRRHVMESVNWLLTNGWASYRPGEGGRRHIYLNADKRRSASVTGVQKVTSSQKVTTTGGAQKVTTTGIQKVTQTRTHKQDPSMSFLSTKVLSQSIDADSPEKRVDGKSKPLPVELDLHRDLIQAFWKIKKGSKGDIAWKLLCTELIKFHDALGPAVVEEQLTQAINGKWAGINYSRHLQFNPHLVTASLTSIPEYSIR